jgi:hypothetical protein
MSGINVDNSVISVTIKCLITNHPKTEKFFKTLLQSGGAVKERLQKYLKFNESEIKLCIYDTTQILNSFYQTFPLLSESDNRIFLLIVFSQTKRCPFCL